MESTDSSAQPQEHAPAANPAETDETIDSQTAREISDADDLPA